MHIQEDEKNVELQDFSQKKKEIELEGHEPADRDSIFEPESNEQEEGKEIMSQIISEPESNKDYDEEEIKEIRDPKETLISEIKDMQKTLQDLMDKAGRVNGDVRRLESENEVNIQNRDVFAALILQNYSLLVAKLIIWLNLQVLTDYIRNMMEKSEVFKPTDF